MLEALQMPYAELCAFDGDPLKYWMFITAFENNVGCLSVDDSKKLTRLTKYKEYSFSKTLKKPIIFLSGLS